MPQAAAPISCGGSLRPTELFRSGTASIGDRETWPNRVWSQPPRPFSRPEAGADRRHSRDFGRQCARDPAETDSLAEQAGFELLVPMDELERQRVMLSNDASTSCNER